MDAVICGLDPGLGRTGYAILRVLDDATTVVDAGVCRGDDGLPLAQRLVGLERDVAAVLDEHSPSTVAVEDLYSHYAHPRTAVLMGHARGVILLAAARRGVEVRSFAATQVKRSLTGNGRAGKEQVQEAVRNLLGLARSVEPPDVADAIAVAMCCAHSWSFGQFAGRTK